MCMFRLVYAFPTTSILLGLLHKIVEEQIQVILLTPNWPRRTRVPKHTDSWQMAQTAQTSCLKAFCFIFSVAGFNSIAF